MLEPTKTPRKSIAHKLLGAVFGLGVLLTIIFSCIQTLAEYKARIADITQELNGINNTLAPAISTALWGFDRQTLTSQAEGILHFN
jgi:hypothetical protein